MMLNLLVGCLLDREGLQAKLNSVESALSWHAGDFDKEDAVGLLFAPARKEQD